MPFAPGPFVSDVLSEYAKCWEQWADRCKTAIRTSREGGYSFEQFASDVTKTWVESTVANLKPLQFLGVLPAFDATLAFKALRFPLKSKDDTSRMLIVKDIPVGALAAENLGDGTGVNEIPSGKITLTKKTNTSILVELKGLDTLAIPAGLYSGRVLAGGTPIALIEVDFP